MRFTNLIWTAIGMALLTLSNSCEVPGIPQPCLDYCVSQNGIVNSEVRSSSSTSPTYLDAIHKVNSNDNKQIPNLPAAVTVPQTGKRSTRSVKSCCIKSAEIPPFGSLNVLDLLASCQDLSKEKQSKKLYENEGEEDEWDETCRYARVSLADGTEDGMALIIKPVCESVKRVKNTTAEAPVSRVSDAFKIDEEKPSEQPKTNLTEVMVTMPKEQEKDEPKEEEKKTKCKIPHVIIISCKRRNRKSEDAAAKNNSPSRSQLQPSCCPLPHSLQCCCCPPLCQHPKTKIPTSRENNLRPTCLWPFDCCNVCFPQETDNRNYLTNYCPPRDTSKYPPLLLNDFGHSYGYFPASNHQQNSGCDNQFSTPVSEEVGFSRQNQFGYGPENMKTRECRGWRR